MGALLATSPATAVKRPASAVDEIASIFDEEPPPAA